MAVALTNFGWREGMKLPDEDLVIEGSLMDGPDLDLIDLSGLSLTDDEVDRLWNDVSPRELLIEHLECEEVEIEEIDHAPGFTDRYVQYHCGGRSDFVMRLRETILELTRPDP